MACSIPQPTAEGVIRPVPTSVDCQFLVDHSTVKEVRRLTNRDGTRSQAIKITFFSAQLPSSIKLDYQEFVVHAYVPPVGRCTTCNKLGQCRSKVPVCPRCSSRGHTPDVCPNKLCCLNCGGPHSAAYQGCPQRLCLIAKQMWAPLLIHKVFSSRSSVSIPINSMQAGQTIRIIVFLAFTSGWLTRWQCSIHDLSLFYFALV